MIRRFALTLGHYLFAMVFLLRMLVLTRLSGSPFLLPSRGDMHFYDDWAHRILGGELTGHFAFYGLPLYAYILAGLYKVFGYSPFVPGLLQALLESATAVLIYRIALRVLPAREELRVEGSSNCGRGLFINHEIELLAVLAALGWALFVPAQAYSTILMPTAWLVFVFWLIVWRIVRLPNSPTTKECLLLGLLMGVTAMAVATILFLTPLVLGAIFLKRDIRNGIAWARRAVAAGCLFLGIAIGSSPCWIHNYFIARDPVVLSAHSGINFWIGNNPDSNGYPKFPPGLRAGQAAMLEDSITSAEAAAGHTLKRAEISQYWSAKARNYIASHPGEWLQLLLIKLRNFWSAFQYDDLSIITSLREQRVVLPGLYFGLVAALALPGMLLAWRMAPASRWVSAAILLHMAALFPVFVTERYRLPVVPGLLIFAVFGLWIFWQSVATGQYKRLAAYAVLLAASIIFVSWPQRNPSLWALDAYNSGWQALESGDLASAEKKLSLAQAYVPTNPETNFALGNLRLAQGQTELAASLYKITLQYDQTHRGALNNLGVMALTENNYEAAESWFRQAERIDPRNAKTHFLLAKTLLARGHREEAKVEIDAAIHLRPEQGEFIQLRKKMETDSKRP